MDQTTQVKKLLLAGHSQSDISKMTGCTQKFVHRIAANFKEYQENKQQIKARFKLEAEGGTYVDDATIIQYVMEGDCQKDIAEWLGVSVDRITKACKDSTLYQSKKQEINKKRGKKLSDHRKTITKMLKDGCQDDVIRAELKLTEHTYNSIKNIIVGNMNSINKKRVRNELTFQDIVTSAMSDPVNIILSQAWH